MFHLKAQLGKVFLSGSLLWFLEGLSSSLAVEQNFLPLVFLHGLSVTAHGNGFSRTSDLRERERSIGRERETERVRWKMSSFIT